MKTERILCGLGLAAFAASIFGQTASQRLVELRKDPPVQMFRAQLLGPKSESDLLHISISLPYGDPAGVQSFVDAVSDPRSPQYRQFLSPEQIGLRFGLPTYRVQRIALYLQSQGMSLRLVAKNHLTILADATVGQAETAFHTSIQYFQTAATEDTTSGVRFSFTTPPAVPAYIAGDITDIGGLESFTQPMGHQGVTEAQLRTLYSAAAIYSGNGKTGAGRTIAISSYDGFRLSNVPLDISLQSLPTPSGGVGSNITVEPIGGGTGSTGKCAGEGDIDIQTVLGMAPLSSIIIYDNYQSSGGNNPIAVLTQELDDNKADIITESYGWPLGGTSTATSAHNLHLDMSAQGITYCVASGDHGTTWVVNGVDFNYPAIEPEVLLVGGTSVKVTSSGARSSEVGWNDGSGQGGGGWNVTSDTFNARPTYQSTTAFLAGSGVPSLASVPYRLVPDVSFDADPTTGYLIYFNGKEAQAGGTSASSPTCAGMLADLEEQLINDGALAANSAGKYRLGRVNDLLYSLGGNANVFFDVTSGTNGTLPSGKVSNAGTGWDTDSGWGAIVFTGLQAQMEKGVSSLSISPATVASGGTATGTVTLQVAAPTGGAVVSLSSSNTAAAKVPASVTVAAGATSATFTVTALTVASTQSATVTAAYNKISKTAAVSVTAPGVSSVSLSASSVVGGCNVTVTGTVTLVAAAPTGGAVVTLSSSNTSTATVPASVTVAAGSKTAMFTVTHLMVGTAASTTIKATFNAISQSATLTVNPFQIASLSLSPSSLVGGASSVGTVSLNATPGTKSGAVTVKLASSSKSGTVGTSVSVAVGSSSATFKVTTTTVKTNTSSTITGTLGSNSKTTTLTIKS